jgi:hypothetical protein
LLYIAAPTVVFNVPNDGNIFQSYNIFWGCISHTLIIFCGIWLLIYRPYKLSNMYILWGNIVSFGYLSIIVIAAHVLHQDWMHILENFLIPNIFPANTWLYSIVVALYYQLIFLCSICLYKFVFLKYIPQFAYVKKRKQLDMI